MAGFALSSKFHTWRDWLCTLLSAALITGFALQNGVDDSECWKSGFSAEVCCFGTGGNPECWDGASYTYERCCIDHNGQALESLFEEKVPDSPAEDIAGDTVLFNDNLPELAAGIRESLALHAVQEDQGSVDCRADGYIKAKELRAAREEVKEALQQASDPAANLQTPGVDKAYNNYLAILPGCPQAVLQGTIAKLERMLLNLRNSCSDYSLFRACQATTPFMFDLFMYYVMLKYGLIKLYVKRSGQTNITSGEVFRGWPIPEQEDRVWQSFGVLWRIIWPARDCCACVEGYDYYTTLHSLFDLGLHLARPDFRSRVLRKTSEVHRMIQAADHCEEWLHKDFQRIFSSYAKHSACLPGALMENIVCLHRWLLHGRVIGALNTAEMMVKLLTLSGTCLEDTRWPFTKADVMYNFVTLAMNWHKADFGCKALNRFGTSISEEGCPPVDSPSALQDLVWSPSPLQPSRQFGACTADLVDACIVDGIINIAKEGQRTIRELQTCSETGRNFYPILKHAKFDTLWKMTEQEYDVVGFVLNVPDASQNIWHNVHWLIPAVSRLYLDATLKEVVPRRIALMLLFEGYTFTEMQHEITSSGDDDDREQASWFDAWILRHAPFLRLLTTSPPVLFRSVSHRCFKRLLWGHAEMRADRELLQPGAVGPSEVHLFRSMLEQQHEDDMEAHASAFWGTRSVIRVLFVQRDAADPRGFEALDELIAKGLVPLATSGSIVWRSIDDLGRRSLIQQAAIFKSTEVLIGAVGAALAWMAVMRPGTQVIEWLPRGVPPTLYRCSEAWNADTLGMFGGLARLANVDHVCLRGEPVSLLVAEHRRWSGVRASANEAHWRSRSLKIDPGKFERWVAEGVRRASALQR